MDRIRANEALLRGSAFVAVFAAAAIAETPAEARPLRVARRRRWMHNLALTAHQARRGHRHRLEHRSLRES